MPRKFGQTPHSEIAHAFEAENRTHTYVEQMGDGGYRKTYQLRLTLEELLTNLDALSIAFGYDTFARAMSNAKKPNSVDALAMRQLRVKILQTLGLTEEG